MKYSGRINRGDLNLARTFNLGGLPPRFQTYSRGKIPVKGNPYASSTAPWDNFIPRNSTGDAP